MALNIQVKVDATQAKTDLDAVKTSLTGVEQSAQKAGGAAVQMGDAMTSAMGQAVAAFGSPLAQLERQQAMLEKIRGPLQNYTQDLQALDALLDQSTISTSEYADQVTRLNQQLDKSQGKKPGGDDKPEGGGDALQALGGRFGEVGNLLGGLASKGTIEAAALVGVGVAAIEVADKYEELSNSALRLTDSSTNVNDVLTQQLALSGELHGTLEETIALSAAVKEGTDDMNLSGYDQERITRSIAEAVQLSGRSMAEAGPLAERLSYQFASGAITGRELKQEMREFPALGEALTQAFGKSRTELVAMANAGQISGAQLATALEGAGSSLDEKFGKHVETIGQKWDHFKDSVVVGVGSIVTSVGDVASKLGSFPGMDDYDEKLKKTEEDQRKLNDAMVAAGSAIATQATAYKALNDLLATETKLLATIRGGELTATTNMQKYGDAVAAAKDKLKSLDETQRALIQAPGRRADLDPTHNAGGVPDAQSQQDAAAIHAITQAGGTQAAVNALLAQNTREHAAAVKELNEAQTPQLKTYDELTHKTDDYKSKLADLDYLLKNHVKTQQQYNVALADLNKEYASKPTKKEMQPLEYQSVASRIVGRDLSRNNLGFNTGVGYVTPDSALSMQNPDAFKAPQADADAQKALEMYTKLATPAEKYADELAEINRLQDAGKLSGDAYNRIYADLRDRYNDAKTPAEEFTKQVTKLKGEQDAGLISAQGYDAAMRKLRETMAQGTFGDGVIDGLDKIKKSITDVSTAVSTQLTDAFNGANDALVQLATTGTADWNKLLQTIENDAVKSGLKQIESYAVGALKGSGSTSNGNAIDAINNSSLGKLGGLSGSGSSSAASSMATLGTTADTTSGSMTSLTESANQAASALYSISGGGGGTGISMYGGAGSSSPSGGAVDGGMDPGTAGVGGGDLGSAAPVPDVPDISGRTLPTPSIHLHMDPTELVAANNTPAGQRQISMVVSRQQKALDRMKR